MEIAIKKITLLTLVLFLFSCNRDENITTITPSADFFNLHVGNKWVYKTYDNHMSYPVVVFTGRIDTIKIAAIETYQGFTIAKRTTSFGTLFHGLKYDYVRVNNLGHLVNVSDIVVNGGTLTETSGEVIHPGLDQNYVFTTTHGYGEVENSLSDSVNMIVEGNNYFVSPYIGSLTPSPDFPSLTPNTIETDYEQNTGLVKQISRSGLNANFSRISEKRLVYYEVY